MNILSDGSAFFTTTILSDEEIKLLPLKERPLNHRISSNLYHAVFEAIGEASTTWKSECGNRIFNAEKAAQIATKLCCKIADELENLK
jgi:hypothetical protein